ncbi:hypothetical protein [Paenibacillus sp. MMO-177]|uniref:hypothetical protein n=1 Tax=Paenibacillus sp. MMO-177 TaxID=3081289 RepID=UPI00301B56F4
MFHIDCDWCGSYKISHQASFNYPVNNAGVPTELAYKSAAYIKRFSLYADKKVGSITIASYPNPLLEPVRTKEQLEKAFPAPRDVIPLTALNLVKLSSAFGSIINIQQEDTALFYAPSVSGIMAALRGLQSAGYIEGFNSALPCEITITNKAWELPHEIYAHEIGGVLTVSTQKEVQKRYLQYLQDQVEGNPEHIPNMYVLGRNLGLLEPDIDSIVNQLLNDKLIKAITLDTITITPEGIKALSPTPDPVPATTTQNVTNNYTVSNFGHNTAFQIASNGSTITQSNQHTTPPIDELQQLVQFLKKNIKQAGLDELELEEAENDIQMIEKGLRQKEPKFGTIRKRFWTMLGNIGEKVSVNLLTAKFPEALKWLSDKDIPFT